MLASSPMHLVRAYFFWFLDLTPKAVERD